MIEFYMGMEIPKSFTLQLKFRDLRMRLLSYKMLMGVFKDLKLQRVKLLFITTVTFLNLPTRWIILISFVTFWHGSQVI